MKASETLNQALARVGPVAGFLAALIGILASVILFVDWRIASKLRDPQMVQALADEIRRPSLIFDSRSSILDDRGAMEYLAAPPRFEGATRDGPPVIVVAPKVHLASPPLLQVLDAYAYDFIAERGEGFQWIFRGDGHPGGFVEHAQSPNPRFRLEIIR